MQCNFARVKQQFLHGLILLCFLPEDHKGFKPLILRNVSVGECECGLVCRLMAVPPILDRLVCLQMGTQG